MITALCLHLGATRAELRERMSAQELGQWVAIYLVQPFDHVALFELPQALIRATLIQAQGQKPKLDELMPSRCNRTVGTLEDFMRSQLAGGG